jgi:hypothetical protein
MTVGEGDLGTGCCPPKTRRSTSAAALYQTSAARVIDIPSDCAVLDLLHGVGDREQRYEEPFARDHGIAKPILDLDFESGRVKNAVDQVFQLGAADVEQLVRRRGQTLCAKAADCRRSLARPSPSGCEGEADCPTSPAQSARLLYWQWLPQQARGSRRGLIT